jgi:N-acetylglucosamine-6-phosphate deacetylase
MSYYAAALGPDGFGTYEVDWSGEPVFTKVSRPPQALLVPGFVDIHIHGAYGIDFMSASQSDLLVLCDKLEKQGYESFLPTTVTASAADVARAVGNLPEHEMIAGFHLEGPFISPQFPGAQPPSAILEPPVGASEWDAVLDHPKLRLVTLAPELPHALTLIDRLTTRGVVVSMGHTNATYDEARRGFEFGARNVTHTYNAMRPLHHREPGVLGYSLTSDDLNMELIYDRLHVSKEAAALLLKCKPAHRVVAVSDSTMATGLPPNQEMEMWGLRCVTGKREVRLADSGALAGSGITLLDAFRNLAEDFGEDLAIRACCLNPRRVLGMPEKPRVFLELNKNLELVGRRVL